MTEHVKHYVTLMCDVDGCRNEVEGFTVAEITNLRQTATTLGWSSHGRDDFCPEHSKAVA